MTFQYLFRNNQSMFIAQSLKLTNIMNNCLKNKTFLDVSKTVQITACHKKDYSKVFERLIHQQLSSYMELKFSRFLSGFRKNP